MNPQLATLTSRTHSGLVNIIVDTPKGSRNKYKYDETSQCFALSRILPVGSCFPYDFGSIPKTLAEDGDALDVLLLSDAPSFVGCLITAKLIGAITGEQTERGKTIRNDRLIAVPVTPANPAELAHISELPAARVTEIEHFFIGYNRAHGRQYNPIARVGPVEADAAVAEAERRYESASKR